MSLKVLLPEIVRVPAPPWLSVMLVYEAPPPEKVLAEPEVRLIVPVPVTVRFVVTEVSQGVLVPLIVQVPDPMLIVRVVLPDPE
jgi:hypothetical protein